MIGSTQFTSSPIQASRRSGIGVMSVVTVVCALMTVLVYTGAILVAGPYGVAFVLLTTFIASFVFPHFALSLILVSTMFQSFLISTLINSEISQELFQLSQGTSFFISCSLFLSCIITINTTWRKFPKNFRVILLYSFVFMLIVLAYSVIGLRSSSTGGVVSYVRVYFIGLMNLCIGIAFASRVNPKVVEGIVFTCTIMLVVYCFLEFTIPAAVYDTANIARFLTIKYNGLQYFGDSNQVIEAISRPYLNLSGFLSFDFELPRPQGPNIHSISFAYAISFGLIIAAVRQRWSIVLLCLVALAMIGAKGPVILIVVSGSIALFVMKYGSRTPLKTILLFGSLAYIAAMLAYGSATKDYHYLGLMGSINGFLQNPVGHGVGVGGNLSDLGRSHAKDFDHFQNIGASTFALESGLGVLFYQLGIFGAVLIAIWLKVTGTLIKGIDFTSGAQAFRQIVFPVGFTILLASSLFQEETLSPAGWGLWTLMAGMYAMKDIAKSRNADEQAHIRNIAARRLHRSPEPNLVNQKTSVTASL